MIVHNLLQFAMTNMKQLFITMNLSLQ